MPPRPDPEPDDAIRPAPASPDLPARGVPVRVPAEGPGGTAALHVLLSGRPDGPDPPLRAFMDHARTHQMDLSGLWAVHGRRGRPRQAALAVPGVGRTAMLFLSPLTRRAQVNPAADLARAALAAAPVRGLSLLQALLNPDEDLKSEALERGGLTRLAELLYLHRPADSSADRHASGARPALADPGVPAGLIRPRSMPADATDPASPAGLRGEVWSPARNDAFAAVIEASYADTRDCAGLRGLRQIDDVVAGHRATGVFHPGLWTLWSDAAGPLAVLLLAEAAAAADRPAGPPPGIELVYLGVATRGRSRGVGGALLRYALAAAVPFGGAVSLAVDRDNPAARRLYRRAGFGVTTRRTAWIAVPPVA